MDKSVDAFVEKPARPCRHRPLAGCTLLAHKIKAIKNNELHFSLNGAEPSLVAGYGFIANVHNDAGQHNQLISRI
ncbi:hypothetical protein [Pseudomonas sp. N040]|uniref:hypothetical protein n=1 Tax=Pseudomonas sp. N040 TaxID=2785325 RepID=UPI0018A3280B|nr:hypothetical protein [Pseudomonas sp. N040]MBF7728526.1 hypothetical protein [Pseudomonas sp. N040]MBW7012166.1 hypothetical protein [Pseudomonas sp. N040]